MAGNAATGGGRVVLANWDANRRHFEGKPLSRFFLCGSGSGFDEDTTQRRARGRTVEWDRIPFCKTCLRMAGVAAPTSRDVLEVRAQVLRDVIGALAASDPVETALSGIDYPLGLVRAMLAEVEKELS